MALRFLNSGYFAGKVGIGTETPTAPLDVFGVRAGRDWALNNRAVIRLDSNGAGYPSDILFGHTAAANQTSWTGVYWSLSSRGSSDAGKFHFYRGNGHDSPYSSEAVIMTFKPDLKVGIGTTNPAQNFVVADATNGNGVELVPGTTATIQTYNRGTSSYNNLNIDTASTRVRSFDYTSFHNGSGYGEKMRITSTGNVGINTTLPDFKLDVDGTFGVSDLPFNSSSVSVLVANETIGAETITNGDFATDSDWTKSSNVSISGGQATFTANSAAQYIIQGSLWPANSLSGQKVKLTYTIVSNSLNGGDFRIGGYTGASAFTLNGLVTTVGTHNIILDVRTTAGDDNAIDLYITSAATSGALVIDNVSVKQVTSASNQIQKRELGTGAFGPTPVGAYLPLAGGDMTGQTTHGDGVYSYWGDSNDLQIGHDGGNSYIIDRGVGDLLLYYSDDFVVSKFGTSEISIRANQDSSVELFFDNTKKFETTSTGVTVTGDIQIDSALLSNQENTDIDSAAAEVVAQVSTTYTAAFFDFVIKKTTNVRSGTVYACHDGTSVVFTETSTNDLGDTSDVTLSVDISGTNMRLLATVTSDDWSVKSLIRAI